MLPHPTQVIYNTETCNNIEYNTLKILLSHIYFFSNKHLSHLWGEKQAN